MPSIVKQCCRVCGRSVDERSRRSLFTHAGRRDKLPDRLSAQTGVLIDQDDLSEFVCRKCASELERYAHKVACTVIVSWYDLLKWGVSYRSTRLMTCTTVTEIILKCSQAPSRFFVWGLGMRLARPSPIQLTWILSCMNV